MVTLHEAQFIHLTQPETNQVHWNFTMTFDLTDDWQSAVSTEEGDEEPTRRQMPA